MRLSTLSLFFILIDCTWSAINRIVRNKHDSLTYLNKYGYNHYSNSSKDLISNVDYSSMLRDFQQRHDLKITGVLDASTINAMNRPRCGNLDIQSFKSGDMKWSHSSLTWSLRSYPRQISKARTRALVRDAFNAWLKYIPLQIKETCSTCSADFKIDFGRYKHNCNGNSFDGPGRTLAHTFFPENGKIHFDSDEQWTESFNSSGINLYLVAVHHIGHALGLDHNNNRKSIMYPIYNLFTRSSILSDHDRRSIQAIYGLSKNSFQNPSIIGRNLTKKVLFIIVDGIPADVIENASVPNLKKIEQMGGYTRAYVGGEKFTYTETVTLSAPGYMNLLTGTWSNKHNVFDNNVQSANYHYKNIFRLVKEQEPKKKIAIFSTWTDNRVKLIGEQLSTAGNIMFDYKFDGYELNEKLYPHDFEHNYIHNIDQRVTDEASQCIKTQAPDLSWIYLQYTDDIGHRFGDSEQFYEAVKKFDKQIGQIWNAIDYRIKEYKENWLIIVTTDHGRDQITGKNHGSQSDRERTIWIIINSQIMNAYFRDFQPSIVDILPTIARFMNITIPFESQRELDGIPFIGKVSLIKPNASLNDNKLTIQWQVIDHEGNVSIWITNTNLFKDGIYDIYYLIQTISIDKQIAIIDITSEYQFDFYKIILEGQYNMVNTWVFRSLNTTVGDCDGSRCGCYKGYCWAYAYENYTRPGDWWCYTQKIGVYGKKGIWETCIQQSDCSWNLTCGNCRQHKGYEESQRNVC